MSKAAKQSLFILIFLLVLSLGFGFVTLSGKQKVEKENVSLNGQLEKSNSREKKNIGQIKELQGEVKKANSEKSSFQKKLQSTEKEIEGLLAEVNDITAKRDKWKRRIDNVSRERDRLMTRVQDLVKAQEEQKAAMAMIPKIEPSQTTVTVVTPKASIQPSVASSSSFVDNSNDEYWAAVLREKVALEVQLDAMKEELSQRSVEILEVKQLNSNFQIELDDIRYEKEEIEREIHYKEEMINNLSLELARTKNEKKFVGDRVVKMKKENLDLRRQLKRLNSSKVALEKSIVRLTQEKSKIEKQLGNSESIIQSKIDEIWEIKESLDRSFQTFKAVPGPKEIELPPIVVSTEGPSVQFDEGISLPGFDGKVLSINEDNNFLILNLGDKSGVRIGDALSVYRDSKYIARLEVIQVRKDISAADIRDQWTKVQVGDIVR